MLTLFGKFCRKTRIDHDELMENMAKKLNVTTSYLSAVERGKRKVPLSWSSIIAENYKLTELQIQELIHITTIDRLNDKEQKVLSEAAQAIYFQDSSDYICGLWAVLRILLGDEIVNNEGFSIDRLVKTMEVFK